MPHRFAVSLLLPSLVALGLGLAPFSTLTAQEATVSEDDGWSELESFGEEISVEVINLEVWVTDDRGDPVTGLTRDDFQIYEDGEPVELTNFSAYEGTTGSDRSENAPPWEIAPETTLEVSDEPARLEAAPDAVAIPPDERLHLTVLVDNWNIRPADRARVFQDLRQFLAENLEAGDRVAVAVHDRSLQLVQRFTDRPADVVRTLDRLEKVAPQGLQIETERRSTLREIEEAMRAAEESPGIVRDAGGVCSIAIGQMMGAAQRYAATVQGHVQSSAGGLATLSQTLSGVPGRRAVLYVGNGLAQTPGLMMFEYIAELCPEERSQLAAFQNEYDLSWLYEEVAARANAAGVTFYMLEAESPAIDLGLDRASGAETSGGSAGGRPSTVNQNQNSGAGFGPAGSTGRSGRGGSTGRRYQPSTHAQRIESQDRESPLVLIAQQTGGRSFLNAADFSNDFRRLARDLRTYYSLGFRPNDPGDGELHRLEVKLTGGEDHRVRHRLRYRDKPAEERMAERVRGVAQFGTEANPLDVEIEVGESFPTSAGAFRIPARIWVPFERLTLLEADGGGLEGRVRILLATTDATGQLQPVRQKVVPLQVTVPEGAQRPPGEHLIEVQLTLPAGDHHVAVAVRDDLGGQTSYLRERFRVPSPGVAARARDHGR